MGEAGKFLGARVALRIANQIIDRYERAQALTAPPAVPTNITILPIFDHIDLNKYFRVRNNVQLCTGRPRRRI